MIACMSNNRVIWNNNELPWNYPEDLKYFKEKTDWNIVVMWLKTYESIWKPLKNRYNIVLTKQDIDRMERPNIQSYFGIKVKRTDVLDPQYLRYLMQYLHQRGYFRSIASGIGGRVNIKLDDITRIKLQPKWKYMKL